MIKKLLILVALVFVCVPAFAQSVDTAWVRTYSPEKNGCNTAEDIAVDDSGNVYVTGFSLSSMGWPDLDYATIKYYPDGDTAWLRKYSVPIGNFTDSAVAIAVDESGNIYVTGVSDSIGTSDYATIKYYPNGDTAWVRRYNGPSGSFDEATDITVDGSCNVYVTGYSTSGGTLADYTTIKYTPNGDTAWVRRYNGPGNSGDLPFAIAVDNFGNVYVTGVSGSDYATIKYYSNGDSAWVRRYNGPGNFLDYAYALTVDNYGNVYVTGKSYSFWTYSDYATIKYYPNGDTAWVRRYDGPEGYYDGASDIEVDVSGNVYVTGGSRGGGTYSDYATIKYYPNGDTNWVRRYNGPGNSDDYANAIAIDASGNVYVTGSAGTIKYSASGDQLWIISWGGVDIIVDTSSYLYLIGGYCEYITRKYIQTSSEVKDQTGNREKPSEFTLSQNYPNPFNQSTKIEFTLSHSGFVSLNIYDLLGRKIRTLVSENLSSGYKSVLWDGENESGKEVASGLYFYQLKIGGFSEAKKLVLLK